jgi:predicted ATPase with chaperone activity
MSLRLLNDRWRECRCTPPVIQRYMSKISGPLLDRIDIHIDVPAVNDKELGSGAEPESLRQDSRTGHASSRIAVRTIFFFAR